MSHLEIEVLGKPSNPDKGRHKYSSEDSDFVPSDMIFSHNGQCLLNTVLIIAVAGGNILYLIIGYHIQGYQ